jgi:hypothetical protein
MALCFGVTHNLSKVFPLQKIVRIMLELGSRSSCRAWFKKYDIMIVLFLYILSLAMFVINNPYFQTNLSLHVINTRQMNVT